MINQILQISESDTSHKSKAMLRKRSKKVVRFDSKLGGTIQDLIDTVNGHEIAVGLSAVQIGVLSRVFVVDTEKISKVTGEGQNSGMLVMVNPQILSLSVAREKQVEACMSLPLFQGEVERPVKVKVAFQTPAGLQKRLNADGFLARVIQHEIDHLDGILYTDRMLPGAELIPLNEIF